MTPAELEALGVRALICDIDNTLAPYSVTTPDDNIIRWVASLDDAGIPVVFVSNNKAPRVEAFVSPLGKAFFSDCKKPFGRGVTAAAASLGRPNDEIAMLGDQLFTDVLAARLRGFKPLLVTPIEAIENPLFYFKRALEKPVLRRFIRRCPERDARRGADKQQR